MKSKSERTASAKVLTNRDMEMLRWLARVRFATTEHMCDRFGLHVTKARKRLAVLSNLGLINRARLLHNQSSAHHVTRKGLRVAGAETLPVPTVSLQSFLHDEAVVREQITLESNDFEVLTEREMRLAERTLGEQYLVRIPPSVHAGSSTHRPDLVFRVEGSTAWMAVEVELAAKSEARLTAILTGYLAADYRRVLYCVPNPSLVERVGRIGNAVGLGDRLQVIATTQRAAA